MGLLKSLGWNRNKGSAAKVEERYTGVAVGCGAGLGLGRSYDLTVPSHSTVSDLDEQQLYQQPRKRQYPQQHPIYRELPSPMLAPLNEEVSIDSESPLSTGPSPSKTPPQYHRNHSAPVVVRGSTVTERLAVFEKPFSAGDLYAGAGVTPPTKKDICLLRDIGSGSSQKKKIVRYIDESDSSTSSSGSAAAAERTTPRIKRGDIEKKKSWLEQAFTPTGGGNMAQSDEDPSPSPSSSTPDSSFALISPTALRNSEAFKRGISTSSSSRKGSLPSSIFRIHSPENPSLAEQQPLSAPARSNGSSDFAHAYQVWHAKGLPTWQPEVPCSRSTAPTMAASAQDTRNATCADPKGSHHHSDSISASTGLRESTKVNEEHVKQKSVNNARTSSGKIVLLETVRVGDDDDEADEFVESEPHRPVTLFPSPKRTSHHNTQSSAECVTTTESPVLAAEEEKAVVLSDVDGAFLVQCNAQSRQASISKTSRVPLLSMFASYLTSDRRKQPKKVPSKRVRTSSKLLFSLASPRSAAKSRRKSLDKSKQAILQDNVVLTQFGGVKVSSEVTANDPSVDGVEGVLEENGARNLQYPVKSNEAELEMELKIETSKLPKPGELQQVQTAQSYAVSNERALVSNKVASVSIANNSLRAAGEPSNEVPMQQAQVFEKDPRSSSAIAADALDNTKSAVVSRSSKLIVRAAPANAAMTTSTLRIEAYQNYVAAFKTYRKDRRSVENVERTKEALQKTKSTTLKLAPKARRVYRDEAPLMLTLFGGAPMPLPKVKSVKSSPSTSKRVAAYQNHLHDLRRRVAKKRENRSTNESTNQ